MSLAGRLLVAKAQAASRKAARKRRAELERELASYVRSAACADFEAILERYPRGTTQELRGIMARQSMAAYEQQFPAIGRY